MIQINGRDIRGQINIFIQGEIEIKVCHDGRHIELVSNQESACSCSKIISKMNVAFAQNDNLDGSVMITIDDGVLWLNKEHERRIYKEGNRSRESNS